MPKQDDFYIDDDIPDDPQKDFTNNSIVEMLENLSTDDENELRVSFVAKKCQVSACGLKIAFRKIGMNNWSLNGMILLSIHLCPMSG